MSQVIFGEIDWNEGDAEGQSDFMKLKQGKNRLRVMGNPVQYYVHWIETPDGKRQSVNSPIGDPKLVRKLEDHGFKRKPRWIIKVLDRTDDRFKILEISSQIYNGIKSLYLDEDWGPVTGYDVTIERGSPGQQPLYRVTPRPKSPLESSFKSAFQDFNERIDVTKLTQPSDPDKVNQLMGWSSGSSSSGGTFADDDEDLFEFESDN